MGDLTKKQSTSSMRVVGADSATGAETEWLEVTPQNEARVRELINDDVEQAEIIKSGGGVTAFANINDTVGGNKVDRSFVRVYNRGKKIRWRVNGELTGTDGEDIGKGEAVQFPWGANIVIELREQNNDNELDVIITEGK